MEDLPDKLRRNLIVLCAGILAYFSMRPGLGTKAEVFGIDLRTIGPKGALVSTALVLIYVFLRHWYDKDAVTERKLIRHEFNIGKAIFTQRIYDWNFQRSLAGKWGSFFDLPELEKAVLDWEAKHNFKATSLYVEVQAIEEGYGWKGVVTVHVRYIGQDAMGLNMPTSDRCGVFPFDPVRFITMLGNVAAVWRVLSFSKVFIDVVAPYLLAFIAFSVLLVQLAMVWVGDMHVEKLAMQQIYMFARYQFGSAVGNF